MKKILFLFAALISLNSYSQTTAYDYNVSGVEKYKTGQYDEAIKDFSKSIELKRDAVVYANWGNALKELSRYEEAIIEYDKAIELDSKSVNVYLNRGYLKYRLNRFEDSIKDFEKAIELDTKLVNAYLMRGYAKSGLNHYEESIKDFDTAIELDSKSVNAYLNRGHAKYRLDQYAAAIKDYDRVIELDSKSVKAYLNRGYTKVELGQYAESIKDYDKAIELDSKSVDAYYNRGVSKSKLGQTEEAIKDFDRAIDIDSKNTYAYHWAGKCYSKLNNISKAKEYFNKVLSLNNDATLTCWAKIYLGQKDIALFEMEEIVNKSQSATEIYSLAGMYAMTGETDKALKDLDIALNKGYKKYIWMQNDENIDFLHYKPEYLALLKKYNISNIHPNIPLSKIITNEVKVAILKWQEKGEFETTPAYTERMKSRDQEVKTSTQEVTNRLKNDFLPKINWSNAQIERYDPDGQSYLLTIEGMKSIVINVPLADAPLFKKNFQTCKIIRKDAVISDDEWVISELAFTDQSGIKKYQYNIKNQPDYNPNKIFSLNFAALDIKVDQYDNSKSQKHVDSAPIVIGLTDVDTNIPTNDSVNPHAYALIVGNEDYSSFQSDLNSEVNVAFAVNDASIFKKYIISTLGIPEENVKFLRNATSGQMNQAISWINKIIQKEGGNAEVFVYYAGHGLPDELTHEPYIIPVDVSASNLQSAIKLQTLYSKLTEYPSRKITVFMDACFSGGSRGQGLLATRGVKIKAKENALSGSIVIFTSSSGEQSSLSFKDKQHGMFTYYLLKKIQETKGNISYEDLYNYMKKEVDLNCVKVNNKEQTPGLLMSTELGEQWKGWKLK